MSVSATAGVAEAIATTQTKSERKAAAVAAAKAAKAAKAAALALVGTSVDSSVQHTNDDSVLSKRSAAKYGYLEDNYLRYFVTKPARRAPLINRGYYLRIVAMTELVEQCLQSFSKKMGSASRLQVLSLGAGFDTLAPRLYLNPLYEKVHFYEVDFPPVIANKTSLVAAAPAGSFPFMQPGVDAIAPGSTTMNFGRFHSLGLDLRNTETDLSKLLTAQGFDHDAPTVVYAECVMQYMTPDCSDGVVRWAAANLPNAIFMAYDQINPYDSFGGVMQYSLRSKCSPLAGIHALPNGIALSRRAVRLGLEEVRFANFYDLSHYHIAKEEKTRVDALEMFDEYEEWCEMCEHYGILCARTRKSSPFVELPDHPALVDVLAQNEQDEKHLATLASQPRVIVAAGETTLSSSPLSSSSSSSAVHVDAWPNARMGLECYSNGSVHGERIPGTDESCIVSFGGVSIGKGTTRTDALFVHSLRDGDLKVIDVTANPAVNAPTARSHHTFSRIAPFAYVAFGGRTNPTSVFNEAFLCEVTIQQGGCSPIVAARWTKLALAEGSSDIPSGRYRHEDVAQGDGKGFFILGGRTNTGARLADVWHASVDVAKAAIKWTPLSIAEGSDAMTPHCTAAACLIPSPSSASSAAVDIIVSGGMSADDAVVGTAYHLSIDLQSSLCKVKELSWAKRVGNNVMGRYAHTMTLLPPSTASAAGPRLLLFGGLGFVPKVRTQYWQPLLVENPLAANDSDVVATILPMPSGHERTSFVRHSVVHLGQSIDAPLNQPAASVCLGIVGGGFTCFSFGIYSPSPLLLTMGEPCGGAGNTPAATAAAPKTCLPAMSSVPSAPYSPEAWARHKASPFPIVLTSTPIGPCASAWQSPAHLKAKGEDMKVAVHVGQSNLLDFVRKNFDFRHVSFADLVDHCWPSDAAAADNNETWYFRSVGANMKTESSNFFRDFPALATEFSVPDEMKAVVLDPITHHQSCFRINQSGMRLWPHYDVMDNVLINVVGHKQVVLFPPTQYSNLYMSGSSSPVLDVCAPDLQRFPRALEALKTAQIVTLAPGDCLAIPALWTHAITAKDACISINLFYKRSSLLKPREVLLNGAASEKKEKKREEKKKKEMEEAGGAAAAAEAEEPRKEKAAPAKKIVYDDSYDGKDLYGNKDLPAMVAAKNSILAEVSKQLDGGDNAAIPHEFKALMLQQLICELQDKANEMFVQSQMRK